MEEWRKILVSADTSLQQIISIIDISSLQIALVIDDCQRLLGTITDGDIRRGLLKGLTLEDAAEKIMSRNPVTIKEDTDPQQALDLLKRYSIRHLPVVGGAGEIIGIKRMEELLGATKADNWVAIMAGGLGSRLRPLTDDCPKPMLRIGHRPLLEIIMKCFIKQGFSRFCLSVNYKGNQIKDYFGDGSDYMVEIKYIEEACSLGTVGSLSLFSISTDKPIIVINGDILTKLNFRELLEFHIEHQAKATVAVRGYDIEIPYGVVKTNRDRLTGFEEKPVYSCFINAGIYVLDPSVLKQIPPNTHYDMNQLLEAMLKDKNKIAVFPIREYWIDIGDMADFKKANREIDEVFK